ncbi:DDE-type integrase/transposase/recombinase [Pollutimonas harenae]|uniref:DDE-type integrase/transposase/recombinase n=1 Tax=Pollutimonas harenae TaxID=657015 RepID=A0A853H1B4_9BURK|nr:DDE-type integrase/transposase/recombinase [Pollutimonas harenae]NYT85025.1 DDE-type integrase/transposase/recombinase [Pollutimonas harenae]TEA72589.1 integrase [Pollutimonas harenae]
MLGKEQLSSLFDQLGTPSKGQALVREARIKAPVRDVQSRGSNVITIFASRKMGCEIRTESRHIEFPAAIDHEFDPTVLEFYPQPCKLHLELVEDATGEIHRIHHTPDFLVIRRSGITLEEWKSDEKLTKLAQRYPYRYQRDSDGNWFSPQIEQQLADLGIAYRICTDRSIPRIRVENLLHLADYYHPAAQPCAPEELDRLHSALKSEGMLFLADLTNPPHSFDADFLFKAIADGLVATDLDNEPLGDQRRCRLYRDHTFKEFARSLIEQEDVLSVGNFMLTLEHGTQIQYQDRLLEVVLADDKNVVFRDQHGENIQLSRKWLLTAHEDKQITVVQSAGGAANLDLARYSDEDLAMALKRQAILLADDSPVSARTLRDWRARVNAAAANGAPQVMALVPHTAARGNRSARLSNEQESLLAQLITQHWKTTTAINFRTLYKQICVAFDEADLKAPSYPTVINRVKAQQTTGDVRIRHGKRMAYQQDEFINVLYADTPTHGSRAFQYVHIDHTQLDIELVSHRTGKPLGRPWLSLAIDAFSRRVVGFYLTFDKPAYHSVLMLMRDIVRRFQRLPEMIVVDNGRDLISEAFQSFLRVMGVHLRMRPAGQPRAGAIMERLFGTVHSQYIHNLAGNTKATKNVRMTTGKHLPVNFAQWTLEAMYHGLNYWATEHYDTEQHKTLGCSPREMFERSLVQSGLRAHRQVIWNEDFLIATCPPVDRGATRKVNDQRGVKVHDFYYWHPVFRDSKVANKNLQVRYDPWDASTAYVRVKAEWVAAKCRSLVGLGQLTTYERQALAEEYIHSGGKPLNASDTPQRMREFLQTHTPTGALAIALDRQQESKSLYMTLKMGAITSATSTTGQLHSAHPLSEDANDSGAEGILTDMPYPEPQPSCEKHAKPVATQDLPNFDTF